MRVDLLIAGGGLAGGLIALALAERRPELSVAIVEAGERLGGNHVWSFFDSDVDAENRPMVEPLVCHRWAETEVAFPGFARVLAGGYNSIESERLDAVVRGALPAHRVLAGQAITGLDRTGATLADGTRIEAAGVIDARGFPTDAPLRFGWQKFVGQLLRLDRPHGLTRPTIMDAVVDQSDGYRFVYLLPFAADQLFVEDTYYTVGRELDVGQVQQRIGAYAADRGWRISAIERQEVAALPIATGGDFERLWQSGTPGVGKAGMAAALFQPMTGYSLPDAVRTAALVASLPDLTSAALERALHDHAAQAWESRGYYRLLARMLFEAAEPPERYRMLRRFYGLDEGLIGRFYAGRSTLLDKARVLCGKPPVKLRAAVRVLFGRRS